MSTIEVIPVRDPPCMSVRKPVVHPSSVCVFPYPDGYDRIALQIRLKTQICTALLSRKEATAVAHVIQNILERKDL